MSVASVAAMGSIQNIGQFVESENHSKQIHFLGANVDTPTFEAVWLQARMSECMHASLWRAVGEVVFRFAIAGVFLLPSLAMRFGAVICAC